jgi:hypothetical protein
MTSSVCMCLRLSVTKTCYCDDRVCLLVSHVLKVRIILEITIFLSTGAISWSYFILLFKLIASKFGSARRSCANCLLNIVWTGPWSTVQLTRLRLINTWSHDDRDPFSRHCMCLYVCCRSVQHWIIFLILWYIHIRILMRTSGHPNSCTASRMRCENHEKNVFNW